MMLMFLFENFVLSIKNRWPRLLPLGTNDVKI